MRALIEHLGFILLGLDSLDQVLLVWLGVPHPGVNVFPHPRLVNPAQVDRPLLGLVILPCLQIKRNSESVGPGTESVGVRQLDKSEMGRVNYLLVVIPNSGNPAIPTTRRGKRTINRYFVLVGGELRLWKSLSLVMLWDLGLCDWFMHVPGSFGISMTHAISFVLILSLLSLLSLFTPITLFPNHLGYGLCTSWNRGYRCSRRDDDRGNCRCWSGCSRGNSCCGFLL
mmetsp:Transcript_7944/g.12605  ORF Transcript_7944/g.12605 Transcript_7944/m.12605 type:complete len:227 (-) Transcript_7944:541-1221(-)